MLKMLPLCFEPQPLLRKGKQSFGLHPCKSPRLISLVIRRYDLSTDYFWVNFGLLPRMATNPVFPLMFGPRLRAPLDQG